jgi:predicted proteasome-type protease
MFEAMETDEDAYWNYLKAGAEVKLLSMIDVRAGLNRGALSVGLGLDLLVFHIDASYYWREKGVEIGDKTVDALTVRFNLGVDGR